MYAAIMTHRISQMAALLLVLGGSVFGGALFVGCGSSGGADDGDEAEHSGGEAHHEHRSGDEGHHEGHGAMPPVVEAFHDVLAPAWHSDPGAPRVAASCAAAPQLVELAGPLSEAMADHVRAEDGTEEEAAAEAASLTASTDALAASCEGEPDEATVEANIADVPARFHTVMEALQGH